MGEDVIETNKTIKLKFFKISACFFAGSILLSAGLFLSYKKARIAADEIVQPAKDELYYYGTSFLPIGFDDQLNGPSWWMSYEPKTQMIVAPLGVRVSLFGKVIMTEPKDLRKRMLRMWEKGKKKGKKGDRKKGGPR